VLFRSTWFSSGLWTFSTLGWPDYTEDFKNYHPTDLLETGYDILFFWVARMILMTEFVLGDIPFKTVYLHGLVRDAKGRKMSKSLGNNIDPLDVTEKFGADATRMALVVGNTPGTDMRISEDKIKGYKHFANKLWNIARFILESTQGMTLDASYSQNDQRIWNQFQLITKDVTKDIEGYRIYAAAEKTYHYVWHEFADMILEHSKTIFAGASPEENGTEFVASRKKLLYLMFTNILKLLHPFMPFVTEEIYQSMPTKDSDFLMIAKWPE
jgi:valyl-tRNA synthetase